MWLLFLHLKPEVKNSKPIGTFYRLYIKDRSGHSDISIVLQTVLKLYLIFLKPDLTVFELEGSAAKILANASTDKLAYIASVIHCDIKWHANFT